jgi:hypothetical protein
MGFAREVVRQEPRDVAPWGPSGPPAGHADVRERWNVTARRNERTGTTGRGTEGPRRRVRTRIHGSPEPWIPAVSSAEADRRLCRLRQRCYVDDSPAHVRGLIPAHAGAPRESRTGGLLFERCGRASSTVGESPARPGEPCRRRGRRADRPLAERADGARARPLMASGRRCPMFLVFVIVNVACIVVLRFNIDASGDHSDAGAAPPVPTGVEGARVPGDR